MVKTYQADNLDQDGIMHGFFTRRGGASSGIYASLNLGRGSNDKPESVSENRARVARDLGVRRDHMCTLYQIHSAKVVTVTEPWPAKDAPEADAMVTATDGIALGILTADCVPVLFSDPVAGVIGAAHAGWGGALGGILENTITAMTDLGASRENINAAIGPCIHQDSYEVGAEFYDRFIESDAENAQFFKSGKPEHFWFDLPGFVQAQLDAAGIKSTQDISLDTYAEKDAFFSYRRACHQGEDDYGRQISLICLSKR